MHLRFRSIVLMLAVAALCMASILPHPARAAVIDELKEKIADRNRKIADLEKEIAAYQKQIETTGKQATSLASAIRSLELERKRLLTEIRVTENKIESVSLNLQELAVDIEDKENRIEDNLDAIAETIKEINAMDAVSFVENVLTYESVSDIIHQTNTLAQIQESITERLGELRDLKSALETRKSENEAKKNQLVNLREEYSDKKAITESQKVQTDRLLTQTKNQEANYKKALEEKKRQKEEFERELFEFESELRFQIDPSSIPPSGKGVLKWPLDKIRVTQQFGDTDFSRANPGVYNGRGHNGIDFAASQGSAVRAALSGIVEGTGNTDAQPGCYSYGKWILVRHANGLSTLYAHLSLIKVSKGDAVTTGDIIGYSGNTGYSTGPHLHFTVYASQGVKVVKFGDVRPNTNCSNVTLPVADFRAYLNPLLYL